MAKIKQTIEAANESAIEAPQENVEAVNAEAAPVASDIEDTAQGDTPENEVVKTEVEPQNPTSAFALNYLKRHTEIKEVYIDKLGGVFSANTPKSFLKDAVLYQNPFYKQ